jgi:2-keto-4-pentenoate hydratase
MLEKDRIEAANLLLQSYASGETIAPLTSTFPNIDTEDAYAIQLLQVKQWLSEGRKIVGHKVGLTSVQVQKRLGVNQPDFGHLFDDMFHLSGEEIPVGTYLQPKVEPEIAFVLKKSLVGPGVTIADAIGAIDYVVASLEIVGSRIADWKITLADTIADNASSGGVVLGTRPIKIEAADLRTLGAVVYKNGQIVQTGAGAAVLGSPISSLVWLANTLGRLGTPLEAGSVILPGAITPMVTANPGDVITADFNILGSVTATFAH